MIRKTVALLPALCLAGCATMPQNIKPQFVAKSDYAGQNCQQMRATDSAIQHQLVSLDKEQKHASTMGGVWLGLGLFVAWPALFGMIPAKSHDHKDEIARLRGQDVALEQNISERCGASQS